MPVPAGPSSVVSVEEVKARLDQSVANTRDESEIQDMIDAAEAYYTRVVGPLSGTVTEKLDGGSIALILGTANVSALTEVGYSDGTAISLDDLDLDTNTGLVHWGYGTAGRFTYGSRNVVVTYTIGTLPADHRETIIADVAGYFATTQRSASAPPDFPGGPEYEAAYVGTPRVLFPRISELAKSYPVVA